MLIWIGRLHLPKFCRLLCRRGMDCYLIVEIVSWSAPDAHVPWQDCHIQKWMSLWCSARHWVSGEWKLGKEWNLIWRRRPQPQTCRGARERLACHHAVSKWNPQCQITQNSEINRVVWTLDKELPSSGHLQLVTAREHLEYPEILLFRYA